MLLAEIVDRDTQLLRNAASGEWVATLAQVLLLDAAQECPVAGRARPRGRCNLGTCGPGVSRPAGGIWRERGRSFRPGWGCVMAHTQVQESPPRHDGHHRLVSPFWRHFLEMFGVMVVGMVVAAAILLSIVGTTWDEATRQYPTASLLVIAAGMTIPMAAWMLYRGMGWKNSREMAAAMAVPVDPVPGSRLVRRHADRAMWRVLPCGDRDHARAHAVPTRRLLNGDAPVLVREEHRGAGTTRQRLHRPRSRSPSPPLTLRAGSLGFHCLGPRPSTAT